MIRNLVLVVLTASALNGFSQERPLVGAIRWDAWLGKSDPVGAQVNASLGPNHWHDRLPFYANVIHADAVDIDGSSQEVTDAEIEYAAHAQLDYFAFLMYDDNISLSNSLHNFLSSTKKDSIDFCVILNKIDTESISTTVTRVLDYFLEPSFQRVLGIRPLVFALRLEDSPELAIVLKDSCYARGWPEPYVVNLQPSDSMPADDVYDAISRYWYGPEHGGKITGAPYSNLMSAALLNWQKRKDNGAIQIPLVSTGTDGRPRIENPVSWITDPSFYEKYFESPAPGEITAHLDQAFRFVEMNPVSCEANTVLMYAWNENDEGGWLIPTLKSDIDTNTSRIDSLRDFLMDDIPGSISSDTTIDGIASSNPLVEFEQRPSSSCIFPNPLDDNSSIYLNKGFEGYNEIRVINSSSQVVLNDRFRGATYRIGEKLSASGLYYYLIFSENSSLSSGQMVKL